MRSITLTMEKEMAFSDVPTNRNTYGRVWVYKTSIYTEYTFINYLKHQRLNRRNECYQRY
jgi:hypothetical protein